MTMRFVSPGRFIRSIVAAAMLLASPSVLLAANNLTLSVAGRQAALDAVTAKINVGGAGKISIYSGAQPTNPDTAISSQVLLVSCNFSATSFAATNSSGVATANAIASGNPVASGTAAWFRIYAGNGTTAVIDGTVGTAGADLNLGTTTISTGTAVTINSFTLTHP
jgi:hypothetical protein